jgi:hypothetical protein
MFCLRDQIAVKLICPTIKLVLLYYAEFICTPRAAELYATSIVMRADGYIFVLMEYKLSTVRIPWVLAEKNVH